MKARFMLSCSKSDDLPPPARLEVAIGGRSNCGKSSLINSLVGQRKLARTSSTPGRTQHIVFFELEMPPAEPFHLVDLPGYGYAKASKSARRSFSALINSYIDTRPSLHALILLNDIRRLPGDDERNLLSWCLQRGVACLIVLTKADKLSKNKRFKARQEAKAALQLDRRPLAVSVNDRSSIVTLRQELASILPTPSQEDPI